MTTTPDARYEVSAPDYGVIDHVSNMSRAEAVALNWIEKNHTPAQIYDRMARRGKPQLWEATACTGAAHSNPYIDHCAVCMPRWGIVLKVLEVKHA